ncbi:secreted protein [Christiangramia forsetii KT0803]|uniref:Secreted protein n=3 Tax=Christiangramia forsetii TaxID=411153 RepID=A0M0W9_CHRFK|nr:hypothetical protein GCM10011532_29520 [Christiangramia forsetii]CAL66264.1 secreted protein [Christiangramia forsetii KT0803]
MIIKQSIAILLMIIFSGKLITVDSDIFSFILDTNQVILLNPFCERKNNNLKENGDHFGTSSPIQLSKLARIYSNNYQFTEEIKIPEIRDQNLRKFFYVRPLILGVHPRKLYPPPKYSLIS